MSPLIKQQARTYTQIISLLSLISVITIGGCLSLLLMKQQTETAARDIARMEREIVDEERRIRYLNTKLANIHQPQFLEREIKRLGLALNAPRPDQIVYLKDVYTKSSEKQNVAKQTNESIGPFQRSFDLAIMEPLKGMD